MLRPPPWPSVLLIELRGLVTFQGVQNARTLLAQPYPPLLAVAFGDLLADACPHRALASSEGRPRPMAVRAPTFGHPAYGLTWERPLLRASAGSGLVPSFVPRGDGVPMGLSQHVHFSWARTQGHLADDISAQVDQAVRSAVHSSLPMTLKTLMRSAVPWLGGG